MEFNIILSKMPTYYSEGVQYLLRAENDFIKMNHLIGKEISLQFQNKKFCDGCANEFVDLYRMGFCKNCFFTRPEAGESIIRPELSKAHEGIEDRDLNYEKSYQLQAHVVYLANSGGLKVGVTREKQKMHRWMDQGAGQATVFAQTSNRYEAGLVEVAMKEFVADKTHWQRMLKNEFEEVDLLEKKREFAALLPQNLQHFISDENEVFDIDFPVKEYPAKVKSLNLDKQPGIEAKLQGIRGQYLIFEGGIVINLRSHTGYLIKLGFA